MFLLLSNFVNSPQINADFLDKNLNGKGYKFFVSVFICG